MLPEKYALNFQILKAWSPECIAQQSTVKFIAENAGHIIKANHRALAFAIAASGEQPSWILMRIYIQVEVNVQI